MLNWVLMRLYDSKTIMRLWEVIVSQLDLAYNNLKYYGTELLDCEYDVKFSSPIIMLQFESF